MGRIPLVVAVACGLVVGCGQPAERTPPPSRQAIRAAAPPTTREGFLAELIPLPFEALVVVYDVQGPAGMHGALEVLARPGGYRRHNWRLQLPVPGADPVLLEGSAVTSPDAAWAEDADLEVTVQSRPLGALADAYVASSPQIRAAAIGAVRRWNERLARVRAQHPGATDTILGIECLDTRVATRQLCLWEETGLPLRHRGPSFSLEARHIDTHPTLGGRAFDVPVGTAPRQREDAELDAEATLRSLADGDVAVLAMLETSPAVWPGLEDLGAGI